MRWECVQSMGQSRHLNLGECCAGGSRGLAKGEQHQSEDVAGRLSQKEGTTPTRDKRNRHNRDWPFRVRMDKRMDNQLGHEGLDGRL